MENLSVRWVMDPPKELIILMPLDKHYAAIVKLAQLHCFHPYLKNGYSLKTQNPPVTSSVPSNPVNNPPIQSERPNNPNPNNQSRPPLVTQSDITKLEEKMKQQVENMNEEC